MVNIPSAARLRMLAEYPEAICISLFLSTGRIGGETGQDQLKLRHALQEIERRLKPYGLHAREREQLMAPLEALLDNESFWLHAARGLAIFRSPDLFRTYRLPNTLREQVMVGEHFSLKPLFPFISGDNRFYVLALSQNEVRLFEATRSSVRLLDLPDTVPQSLAQTLQYDEAENQLEYHSSASGATVGRGGRHPAIFHGQGVGIDDTKDHLQRYCQQIDRGLHDLLHAEEEPLVLVGVEYLQSIYRQINSYPHLLAVGVAGNPDRLKAEAIHRQAWGVVEAFFQRPRQEAVARYQQYRETERASAEVSKILPAAYYGQVESLFVAGDRELWGRFDQANNIMYIHREAANGDEDLLDRAAVQTFLHEGVVYVVEQAEMPDCALMAAVFRYPLSSAEESRMIHE